MLGAAADVLTEAGHDVTVLLSVLESNLRNRTSLKSTKKTIIIEQAADIKELMEEMFAYMAEMWTADNGNPLVILNAQETEMMIKTCGGQCKKVLTEPGLIEKLKAEKFDLAITEPFDMCAYAVFEAINIRAHVGILSSCRSDHVSRVLGQPIAASYVPSGGSTMGDRMTMSDRLLNFLQSFTADYFFSVIGDAEFEIAKTVVPIKRSWRETLPEATFILSNQIALLDFPAPTFDKIVPIGGLSVKTDKEHLKLDEKWSKILDIRKKNVFLSFGSIMISEDMPPEFKASFLKVFASMPDTTFIWKYENASDPLVEHLDNVYLGEWLPQNELLADPRLSVFVTHGGLGSVIELAMMGKPAVMVPLFADQGRNANMLKRHGGAAVLDKNGLADAELVRRTLEHVIAEESFRQSALRLAEMLRNQPTSPQETLLKYVEFAAR
ncbi:unnamed protein product [Caenorhabditis sp. 36 PRJEB53466]|nr:unnamed protein product [Caenorhabditis sp. 36 PRJEB53466]